jgi:hypothetical protein
MAGKHERDNSRSWRDVNYKPFAGGFVEIFG